MRRCWCRIASTCTLPGSAPPAPWLLVAAIVIAPHSDASARAPLQENFANLSLEELANVKIISVSKKPESLADAAASVYVINRDDLRRSGAVSLPEALRLAPNLQVARINSQNYAITARGSNSTTANKLLVLIDGRTVYTPLYSGVFWDAQELMLEDVERIEVISGPGGTLWGTNAVNGVINVITRSAKDTAGGLVALGTGNRDRDGALRYGRQFGQDGYIRFYGKLSTHENTATEGGGAVDDAWRRASAGFRADWSDATDRFTFQGEASQAHLDQVSLPLVAKVAGANLQAQMSRQLDNAGKLDIRAYYDRTERNFPGSYHETLDIVDFQFQHSLPKVGAHMFDWGASVRYSKDKMDNGPLLAFLPADLHQTWSSVFVQDEVHLGDSLRLTGGIRLERNDYTGLEVLPSIRLGWNRGPAQLLWAALSRAVRAPSRVDRDLYAPATPPFRFLLGNSTFRSEIAKVLELGYRAQPSRRLSYSVTAYFMDYEHLRTGERLPGGVITVGNMLEGSSKGIEAWGSYQAAGAWRLSAGLTAMRRDLRLKPGSTDPGGTSSAGNDPSLTWQLRSAWDFNATGSLDVTWRHVGALPRPHVPSYDALDVRAAWRIRPDMELSLSAQNLLGGKHAEFGSLPNRSEIAPRAFIKLLWRL